MGNTAIAYPTKKQILAALKSGWCVGQAGSDDLGYNLHIFLPNPDTSKRSSLVYMNVHHPGEEVELAIVERYYKDIQFINDPYPSVIKRAAEIKEEVDSTLNVK